MKETFNGVELNNYREKCENSFESWVNISTVWGSEFDQSTSFPALFRTKTEIFQLPPRFGITWFSG
jgi:hypothetical protein